MALSQSCRNISESFARMSHMYARIDQHISDISSRLDDIDDLVVKYRNRDPENRPTCIPGFYDENSATAPTPMPTPIPPQQKLAPIGSASNAVRSIRKHHYR